MTGKRVRELLQAVGGKNVGKENAGENCDNKWGNKGGKKLNPQS